LVVLAGGVVIGTGQKQQVVQELSHPRGLLGQPGQELLGAAGGVAAAGVGEGDVEFGAHRGQRAAQLVGGVANELLLAGGGVIDPGQHRVQGGGQTGELIAGGWDRDPATWVGAADPGRTGPQAFHRPQSTTDGLPSRRSHHLQIASAGGSVAPRPDRGLSRGRLGTAP